MNVVLLTLNMLCALGAVILRLWAAIHAGYLRTVYLFSVGLGLTYVGFYIFALDGNITRMCGNWAALLSLATWAQIWLLPVVLTMRQADRASRHLQAIAERLGATDE